jgi:hypothetical protein
MELQGYEYIKAKNVKNRGFEMLIMKRDGATYEEIGKAFNISKQRVYQIIGEESKAHFREITSAECIYPNLRKWMNDNRISRSELTRRAFGDGHRVHYSHIYHTLRGESADLRKSTIDRYLAATGLTYEEFFYTEGAADNGGKQ